MELAHSLLLNEDGLKRVPEVKRNLFIAEWLRYLNKILLTVQKVCYNSSHSMHYLIYYSGNLSDFVRLILRTYRQSSSLNLLLSCNPLRLSSL